jgi:hypothetical protein
MTQQPPSHSLADITLYNIIIVNSRPVLFVESHTCRWRKHIQSVCVRWGGGGGEM